MVLGKAGDFGIMRQDVDQGAVIGGFANGIAQLAGQETRFVDRHQTGLDHTALITNF